MNIQIFNGTAVLHYIELPKVAENVNAIPQTAFERWVHILKFSAHYCGSKSLPEWAKQEEGIPMAMHELERINADKQYRQILETREKSDLIIRTLITEARDEGRMEGRDEGRKEGRDEGRKEGRDEGRKEGRDEGRDEERKEIIQMMLKMGHAPEVIAKFTGLPLNRILVAETEDKIRVPLGPNKVSENSRPFVTAKPIRTRKKV